MFIFYLSLKQEPVKAVLLIVSLHSLSLWYHYCMAILFFVFVLLFPLTYNYIPGYHLSGKIPLLLVHL